MCTHLVFVSLDRRVVKKFLFSGKIIVCTKNKILNGTQILHIVFFIKTCGYSMHAHCLTWELFSQVIREILPSMLERNSGHIVTISSMTSLKGLPLLFTYSATKFAVTGKLHVFSLLYYMMHETGQCHTFNN